MISGIYALVNDLTGEAYVGQSADLEKRMLEHYANLTAPDRRSYPKLRKAFNDYGPYAFSFQLLEICEPLCFNDREAYWINTLDSRVSGYNERSVNFTGNRAYCEDRIEDFLAELEATGNFLDLMKPNEAPSTLAIRLESYDLSFTERRRLYEQKRLGVL